MNGLDLSHHNTITDWPSLALENEFAIVKATEGTGHVDRKFHQHAKNAFEHLERTYAYHFFRPKYNPEAQADFFYSQVSKYSFSGLALDFEATPNGGDYGRTDGEYTDGVKNTDVPRLAQRFLERLEERTNLPLFVYTANWYMSRLPKQEFWRKYQLWIANWSNSDNISLPYPWQSYAIRQTTCRDTPEWATGNICRDQMDMSKYTGCVLGSHIIGEINPLMDDLQRWKPRLILALDRSPDELQRLKDINPLGCLVNRRYVPDNEMSNRITASPINAAQFTHNVIAASNGWVADYHIVENEVLQAPGAPHEKLIEYADRRIDLANQHGYKCALLGLGVGHLHLPENDRFALWRKFVPVLRKAADSGHILCIHQYGSTSFNLPDEKWYSMRFEYQVADWLFSQIPHLQYVVTELGLNQAVGAPPGTPHSGWRDFMTADQYYNELIRYIENPIIVKNNDRCIGTAIFTHGSTHDWASKDIHPHPADKIAAYGASHQIEMGTTVPETPIYQVKVTVQELNFRSGPGTNFPIIDVLIRDEILDVLDESGLPWLKMINNDGATGYASTGRNWLYLEKIEPAEDLESRVMANEISIAKNEIAILENTGDISSLFSSIDKLILSVDDLDKRISALEQGQPPEIQTRFSQSVSHMNMRRHGIVGDGSAKVKDVWTTHNGQWTPDPSDIYAVEPWAVKDYLKHDSGEAGLGGEVNFFVRVEDKNGNPVVSDVIFRWPTGESKVYTTDSHHGWTNTGITGSFVPERGEEGLWTCEVISGSEIWGKHALPSNRHVSCFVVYVK